MNNKVVTRIQKAKTGEWTVSSVRQNLRVNDGINWQAQAMGNQYNGSATGSSPIQIGTSETADAPSSGTTNLWGELAANGMSRETATFAHTADASSYTLTAQWQNTGSTITVATAAVMSALTDTGLSTDTHFVVTNLSPVAVLDSNDTLEIQWGIFY